MSEDNNESNTADKPLGLQFWDMVTYLRDLPEFEGKEPVVCGDYYVWVYDPKSGEHQRRHFYVESNRE